MSEADDFPPILRVLNALCTLQQPSTAMLAGSSGLSEWAVKRQLVNLRDTFKVQWRFERSGKSVDGGRGHYVIEDMGVFDRSKVIGLCLPKPKTKA